MGSVWDEILGRSDGAPADVSVADAVPAARPGQGLPTSIYDIPPGGARPIGVPLAAPEPEPGFLRSAFDPRVIAQSAESRVPAPRIADSQAMEPAPYQDKTQWELSPKTRLQMDQSSQGPQPIQIGTSSGHSSRSVQLAPKPYDPKFLQKDLRATTLQKELMGEAAFQEQLGASQAQIAMELSREDRLREQKKMEAESSGVKARYHDAELKIADIDSQIAKSKPDPNRYWKNQSVGQMVAGIIAGAFAQLGTTKTGGANPVLQMLERAAEQDYLSQEKEIEQLRRRRGDQVTTLGLLRQQYGDNELAKQHMLMNKRADLADVLRGIGMQTQSATVRTQADFAASQLEQKASIDREHLNAAYQNKVTLSSGGSSSRAQYGYAMTGPTGPKGEPGVTMVVPQGKQLEQLAKAGWAFQRPNGQKQMPDLKEGEKKEINGLADAYRETKAVRDKYVALRNNWSSLGSSEKVQRVQEFRTALARLKDQYRHDVTGAAAAAKEIELLEGRVAPGSFWQILSPSATLSTLNANMEIFRGRAMRRQDSVFFMPKDVVNDMTGFRSAQYQTGLGMKAIGAKKGE